MNTSSLKISGFHHIAVDAFILLGCYAAVLAVPNTNTCHVMFQKSKA